MPRSPFALLFVAVLAIANGACSKGGGPAEELKSLFELLGNPLVSQSRLGSQVYASLDEASRSAVDARAKALGERLGTKVDPDEILQIRGLVAGARVAGVAAIKRDEERATLEVSFAPITWATATAVTEPPPPVLEAVPSPGEGLRPMRLEVVKEAGRWRIAFAELARFVASRPLDADIAGAQP